jgi:TatD DNase family protein
LSNLIDSHVNFGHDLLKNDVKRICQESINEGIERMLCINSNLHNFQKDFELIKDHKFIDISVGHHPNSTSEIESSEIPKFIEQYINDSDNRIVGIGETGLDYHYQVPRIKQIECFELHLEIASKYRLPIIVHMRDAEEDMIDILSKYRAKLSNILIHCFTGSQNFANQCIKMDCYYSLSGIITFKNADILRNVIKTLPLNRIIFETDSPYLTPDPFRGKTNEPKYLKTIIEKYSKIMSTDLENIKKESNSNYKKLFQIF